MRKLASIILVLLMIGISPVVSLAGEEKGSIKIEDVTSILLLEDTGNQLKRELEVAFQQMGIDLNSKEFQYLLKFKIIQFNKGSQVGRLFSLGLSDSARGELVTKVALYRSGSFVGAWEINSWVSSGSSNSMFGFATDEIIEKFKSVYPLAEQKHYALEQKGTSDKLARERWLLEEESKRLEAQKNSSEADRLNHERQLIKEEREKLEALRLDDERSSRQAQAEKESPPPASRRTSTSLRNWIRLLCLKDGPCNYQCPRSKELQQNNYWRQRQQTSSSRTDQHGQKQ
jgi:hypothetical protein